MKKSLFHSGVLLHSRRCRTQNAAFLRSFFVVLFLLPLLSAHAAYGDINAELLQAAAAGNTAKVEQLLKQGADVNANHYRGWTALMHAAAKGHTETVMILIAAGSRSPLDDLACADPGVRVLLRGVSRFDVNLEDINLSGLSS
jgi:ankyrin repeat protein